ncbi:MAG TPA: hypothetical protein VFD55_01065 [Candidatus Angelobacter sp.]|nr:hypothetical protein [Candidatus Angelobacter sp.]
MELASKIYQHYLDNSHLLSDDKLFHFASRIAAWQGRLEAFELLKKSHDFIVQPHRNLNDVISGLVNGPQTGKRNAHELRQPFFEKYPQLYGAHMALFRVRHLEVIYGIDARQALFAVTPEAKLIKLEQDLLNDDEAMRVLSTFAINYCYLFERVVRKNEQSLPIQHFYDLGAVYDVNDIQHLQLLIYLYTHCIIGESNFYTREITDEKLPIYRKMLSRLEGLIVTNFDKINLDNKLEFLVCARICDFKSKLFERVYHECEKSISHEGMFIIDIHNQNAQDERNDFIRSEHRNVLFIMSTTEYAPHSTFVR